MSLCLDHTELLRVQRLNQILLSPFEYPDLDDWRRAVCRAARDLLGADMATFQLPNPEAPLFFTEEFPQEMISRYPERSASLDRRYQMWRRKAELGVCSRAMLWGPDIDEYERDSYFHDYVVPARGFDAILLSAGLDSTRHDAETVASLMFHHDTPAGPRFGARGLALLSLIRPAFEAGVRSYRRLVDWREGLGLMLDGIPSGMLLMDLDGSVLHENTALAAMLRGEPENARAALRSAMQRLGRSVSAAARVDPSRDEPAFARPPLENVRTARAIYQLKAVRLGESLAGAAGGVLVSLERSSPEIPTGPELRERFGLTRKEGEVAVLLARGRSNDEVAKELFISPHTARRHTERVLQKLSVRSRSEVAATLYTG